MAKRAGRAITAADFIASWALHKRIEDHGAGTTATFEGRCLIAPHAPDPTYLALEETGRMFLPGQPPLAGSRRYLWRADPAGRVEVAFDDGRPFHRIDLTQDAPSDTHRCDPDTYRVTYDFTSFPRWRAVWRVTGPRKNYTMSQTYTP
ncbi:DUF6314 family protein [Brevirhabdus sp.]|uniref:DUF6314 family protein n=1 Tax=Brevirhabdus sp. TaxID=2004514 RepID=UPI00405A2A57